MKGRRAGEVRGGCGENNYKGEESAGRRGQVIDEFGGGAW